jgi:hypothetical protein
MLLGGCVMSQAPVRRVTSGIIGMSSDGLDHELLGSYDSTRSSSRQTFDQAAALGAVRRGRLKRSRWPSGASPLLAQEARGSIG